MASSTASMLAFKHPEFAVHPFEDIPLGCDIFMMDERWMIEYEAACVQMFDGGEYPAVGYISYVAVRSIETDTLEVSWYPNITDRFHEMLIRLPRSAFICCVETPRWDKRPRLFVQGSWLTQLHLKPYSAFALVDAIGVKHALSVGALSSHKLVRVRSRVDDLAAANPGVAFVSFADSLLLKTNWFVGQYDSEVTYSYEPETLIRLMPSIAEVFREEIGLHMYAAITQGFNEYEDTSLLHSSKSGNHFSLNSLGLPFAQLMAIDEAARAAIRDGGHEPADLYMDRQFFNSLRFSLDFKKDTLPYAEYRQPLASTVGSYVYANFHTILDNLETRTRRKARKSGA
jgi:hypothetical protein